MSVSTGPSSRRRVRVNVRGTVQGVGFRPFVYRLARSLELGGFVRNDATGVAIEVEGDRGAVDAFLNQLTTDVPAHARIAQITVDERDLRGNSPRFIVEASRPDGAAEASIPADLATCEDCLRELFDSANRRFRYPFTNCTNCGPRFTIAIRIPYDRAATTMAEFTMCDSCAREYGDPGDRRFHAQPNACWTCGPTARLTTPDGQTWAARSSDEDAVYAAARALRGGAIVAVKGLGGYHLACRANDREAVRRLRSRKVRDDKPFAVMVETLAQARELADVGSSEAVLLRSSARPIVLLRAHRGAAIAPDVSPGRRELGVMLPYTPLHHLLLRDLGEAVVLTSGNRSDEPIAYRDDDAVARLTGIADLFLSHDRRIVTACEDSVARVVQVNDHEQTLMIRRSRGFVPDPIPLPSPGAAGVLGTGGQLKNTVCVSRGREAVVGPHGGDLGDAVAHVAYAQVVDHLVALSGATIDTVAYDPHPDYHASRYALERAELVPLAVQHHHAHFAACLAEYAETGAALGLIFDGAGYGDDGATWGGEILFGDVGSSVRVGHLRGVRLPGGDAAVREPWRMACSWLVDAHEGEPTLCTALRDMVSPAEWRAVTRLAMPGTKTPITTSIGRLFDACAAICGICPRTTYEGQAAIELETAARGEVREAYTASVYEDSFIVIDPRPMLLSVERDANAGRPRGEIAAMIHNTLIRAATRAADAAARRVGLQRGRIVLSGGVFQNVRLLEGLAASLRAAGFRVFVPQRLPPNDGGLSYGQVAAARNRGLVYAAPRRTEGAMRMI